MGPVITNQPNTQGLASCEKREKRKVKMCNTHQQNPQQNQSWQGVYPDLSALNELFSPQATVNSETSSSSPWIAFLSSLGLQPIPGPQQQARPGTERQDGQTFSGTNSAAWSQGQGYHQSPPLLLSCHPGLRHVLLHPGLHLHPLQPPRLPDPVCPLRGVGHLPPSPSPAHCAGRPPPLLRHLLPPPPLRPRPPPPLPPQAARERSTSC